MTEHNTTRPKPDELPEPALAEPSKAPASAGNADCEYAPRVSAYHDGEVSQDEAREVTSHLAGCPACAAQLAFYGRVSSTFEAAPLPHLAPDARQRLEELGDGLQPNRLRIKPSADVRWVRRLTAAAAVLFIVAVGKVIYDQQFASPNTGKVTPVTSPHDPVVPPPQPVSEDRPGASHGLGDSKTPAVSNADFVQGAHKSATTGQADKP